MRLTTQGLTHGFPGQPRLFSDVNIDLTAGHVASVTGPSGSGKTTLLGLLAGWTAPVAGTIERTAINAVSWVFQNPHGVPGRSAIDHVALPLLARGADRREAERHAFELMSDFGVAAVRDRPFRALSGGEAQRLMLARAVAADPDLILVDEPTAQLDAVSAASVISALTALAGRGAIVIIATHDARVRDACTDHIDLAPR